MVEEEFIQTKGGTQKGQKWIGETPKVCDFCKRPITIKFIDGHTSYGGAFMCPECHRTHGVGFGIGRGQLYEKKKLSKVV